MNVECRSFAGPVREVEESTREEPEGRRKPEVTETANDEGEKKEDTPGEAEGEAKGEDVKQDDDNDASAQQAKEEGEAAQDKATEEGVETSKAAEEVEQKTNEDEKQEEKEETKGELEEEKPRETNEQELEGQWTHFFLHARTFSDNFLTLSFCGFDSGRKGRKRGWRQSRGKQERMPKDGRWRPETFWWNPWWM